MIGLPDKTHLVRELDCDSGGRPDFVVGIIHPKE